MSRDGTGLASAEIAAEIRRFIAEETLSGPPDEHIDDDALLVAGGLLDSLELAELVTSLQERFRVSISPTDMSPADLRTVRTLCGLVLRGRARESG